MKASEMIVALQKAIEREGDDDIVARCSECGTILDFNGLIRKTDAELAEEEEPEARQ